MPALAAPAKETRLAGRAAGGLPELASFRAAFPGYEDTSSLDDLRASEYGYASVGLASTIEDVQTFLALLHDTYRDQLSPGGRADPGLAHAAARQAGWAG